MNDWCTPTNRNLILINFKIKRVVRSVQKSPVTQVIDSVTYRVFQNQLLRRYLFGLCLGSICTSTFLNYSRLK